MSRLEELQQEIAQLRGQLRDAEECIQAIHDGRVDAFVVGARDRERVFFLESSDGPFRILVEHMQQGAVTLGPDGTVLYANERFAGLLERPREQLVGQRFTRFIASEDRPLFEALTGGEVDRPQGELRLERANGTRLSAWLCVEPPSRSDDGETCLLITDLTQQKQHEALIEAGTLARLVVEQAPEIVVICDPDDTIVLASPPAREICGRNPLWRDFGEVFPVRIQEPSPVAPRGVFEPSTVEDQVRALEVSLVYAEQRFPQLLCASPVRDNEGARLGSVVTLADIGALKRAESELREADRRKDEFLAMLAHELRNPLAPIVSGLEVLKLSDGTDERAAPVFRMIQRQVDQLVRLVDDLLEISRIARGKIELRLEVVEVADVLNDALETSRPLIEAMQHTLEVDVPTETVRIECDGVRLSQVIANLLNNAAKYTPRGGRVGLSAHVAGNELVMRVWDTGYGIDPEALDSVFEMFTQTRPSSRAESGLGVGLALVRTLVRMHGGTVSAASKGRGCGSEFTVHLPLGQIPEQPVTGGAVPVAPSTDLERILVVDDNRDSADSLGMLLDILHYQVRVAFDGPAALEELERWRAQVVFLDIDMPVIDGYEVARRIRARPEFADVVLVALTGWGQNNDRALSSTAGFDHHLVKPVAVDALRAVLAAASKRVAGRTGVPPDVGITRH